jgi:hypothetical protein
LYIVELLLKDERVNPSSSLDIAIRSASQNDHLKIVEMLLGDKRVDPASTNNKAIQLSALRGHLSIVQVLLKDHRVNPDSGIFEAFRNCHAPIYEALMKDSQS